MATGPHSVAAESADTFWLPRWLRTIVFVAAVLTIVGIFGFFRTPIAVFPDTNFPRVVIGVDNGVMPVEQMQVTITKPIEDAVNVVPGLSDGPLHHKPRLRGGQPVLRLVCGYVPHAGAGQCRDQQCAAGSCRQLRRSRPTG